MRHLSNFINIKVALIIVVLIGLYVFLSENEYRLYIGLRNNSKKITQEMASLQSENELLKLQTEDLEKNNRTLEIKARTELGLVNEDEIIYEISK